MKQAHSRVESNKQPLVAAPAPFPTADPALEPVRPGVTQTIRRPVLPAKKALRTDADRERRIHEQLLADRANKPNEGLRILFPVALVGAIALRSRLGLDWVETIQAIILCLPLCWLMGKALYALSAFLPAFDESAAALVSPECGRSPAGRVETIACVQTTRSGYRSGKHRPILFCGQLARLTAGMQRPAASPESGLQPPVRAIPRSASSSAELSKHPRNTGGSAHPPAPLARTAGSSSWKPAPRTDFSAFSGTGIRRSAELINGSLSF
jgi:hypothetical protein